MILPWKTTEPVTIESRLTPEELLATIAVKSDFERYSSDYTYIGSDSSASSQIAAGSKPFIGVWNTTKGTFMLWRRHGNSGQPIMGRVVRGTIEKSKTGSGSTITYQFTLRPWDRFFLCIGLGFLALINLLVIFGCIVKPPPDWLFWLTVCPAIFALAWFSPTIAQFKYRQYETDLTQLLQEVSQ